MKKLSIYICFVVLFTCCLVQGNMAQAIDIELEAVSVSSEPFFIAGTMDIAGFTYVQDYYMEGTKIGSVSGTTTLINPPLDLTLPFTFVTIEATVSIPGLGTFDETGYGVGLTNISTPLTGEITMAVTGSVENGTGALTDIYGVVTGLGTFNLYTSQGSIKQTYRLRIGY